MYSSGDQMINVPLLFEKGQLQKGMHIADLGCGRLGHIVFPGAKKVCDTGIVYAADILKEALENIRKRAAVNNFLNIHTVWSNLEIVGATAIPANSLDVAFIINVLVHSDNRHGILEEAHRLLKDKARLILVDWSRKNLSFGPPSERYVDFEDIKRWSRLHGFVVQEEFDMGYYHHGLVLFKQD